MKLLTTFNYVQHLVQGAPGSFEHRQRKHVIAQRALLAATILIAGAVILITIQAIALTY